MHWHYLVSHLIRTPFANRYLNCTRNRKANNNGLFTQLDLVKASMDTDELSFDVPKH